MNEDMIARIDEWLATCSGRELISSDEVADILLDLRLMCADTPEHEDMHEVFAEPVPV